METSHLIEGTVLVTGASRGQGAAEAQAFVAAGAHVLIADVLEEEGSQLADALGERARFVRLDVRSPAAWEAAVDVPHSWPPLRVLVNNAGVHHALPIEFETAESAMGLWEVNLLGPLLGIKHVTPKLRDAGGGSIINVASAAALIGLAFHGAYGASKWGLRGLSRTAAIELGRDRIRVNCIFPGPFDTPMARGANDGALPDFSHIPLGRVGHADEVTGAVLFLASDASGFVTGAEFAVDGGLTAGPAPRADQPRMWDRSDSPPP
ncbi:MAG: SDR family oxidoreductase [Actinomycetota bacterium]